MSGTIIMAHGVGGLKACVHGLAIEHVLQQRGVEVPFRTGASGGSLAAATMSFSVTETKGIPWLIKRISKINEKKLYDEDALQQAIDRVRKIGIIRKLVGTRKGDKPMLGLYRGNGLLNAIRELFGDLGTIVKPFEVVSCSLSPDADMSTIPLAAMNGLGQKRVRRFSPEDNNTTGGHRLLVDALRASIAIPFVIRPHMIDGAHEVDGGTLSLTTEEVAADWIKHRYGGGSGGRKIALLINDMQSLPNVEDGVADDFIELGVMLLRAVGAHIQAMNRQYAIAKLEPLQIGIWRLTPPKTTTRMRQFETSKAPALFDEYLQHLRVDDRLGDVLAWLGS